MSLPRLYLRVLQLLGKEARLGWILAGANLLLAAAQFAEPVLFGKIVDVTLRQAGRRLTRLVPGLAIAAGLGRVRPVHDPVQRRGRAARRPAGASPASGGADELFRTYHATAAHLPHRHPFGAADEGDDQRHRCAVAAVARIFPRAFRRDPVAGRAAAAGVLHQLAAGDPVVRALRGVHRPDDDGGAQDLRHAERRRDLLRRSFGACFRRARQCRAGAELRARRCRGAGRAFRRQQIAGGADAGVVVVGAGHRDHAGIDHDHDSGDLHGRHRAARTGPDLGRRDRDVRLFRHAC